MALKGIYQFKRRDGTTRAAIFWNDIARGILIFDKIYLFPSWPYRVARRINSYIPKAWAVGLRSCDEPHWGRVYMWYFTWTLTDRRAWSDHGDGPDVWSRIPWREYFKRRNTRSYVDRSDEMPY